jgi:transposase
VLAQYTLALCSGIFGDYAIRDWQRRFLETGSAQARKKSGRPGVSDECVETIRASFVRSPTKSTRQASHELLLPRSTIYKVLHNTQFFKTPSGLCGHTVQHFKRFFGYSEYL